MSRTATARRSTCAAARSISIIRWCCARPQPAACNRLGFKVGNDGDLDKAAGLLFRERHHLRFRRTTVPGPHPGEFGSNTWSNDSWKDRMGANVWSTMSVDQKHGIVFLPIGSPAYDFYGGDRKGKNLFGNSLVALNAATGKLIWYFQMVHHDLWTTIFLRSHRLSLSDRMVEQFPRWCRLRKWVLFLSSTVSMVKRCFQSKNVLFAEQCSRRGEAGRPTFSGETAFTHAADNDA